MTKSRFIAWFISFIAMFMVSVGAWSATQTSTQSSSDPVATTEIVTLGKGETLWASYVAQKRPLKDWPNYWKETSLLSKTPHSDKAYRMLPIGTKLTTPRDPRAIVAEEQFQLKLTEIDALVIAVSVMNQSHAEMKSRQEINKNQADLNAQIRNVLMGVAVVVSILVYVVASILLRTDTKKKETIDSGNAAGIREPSTMGVAPCGAPGVSTAPLTEKKFAYADENHVPPHWHST